MDELNVREFCFNQYAGSLAEGLEGLPILDYINGYVHVLLNEQISPMPLSKGGH